MGKNEAELRRLCLERGFDLVIKPVRSGRKGHCKAHWPDGYRIEAWCMPVAGKRALVSFVYNPSIRVSIHKEGVGWYNSCGWLDYETSPVWLREAACLDCILAMSDGRVEAMLRQHRMLGNINFDD